MSQAWPAVSVIALNWTVRPVRTGDKSPHAAFVAPVLNPPRSGADQPAGTVNVNAPLFIPAPVAVYVKVGELPVELLMT